MECDVSTRPRVLLADDYPDMVRAVGRLLAPDCEVVGSVADGSALLEAAQRLRPDVIVLDLNLPNVHGVEACRRITKVNPEMKVIVFTATSDPEVRQRCLDVGASAFVSKLTAAGDLLSAIKRLSADRLD
jgi:CheY-like chemotaxis protein